MEDHPHADKENMMKNIEQTGVFRITMEKPIEQACYGSKKATDQARDVTL